MSQESQIIRQWQLIRFLESGSDRTVAELAQELKCSERTIWRDLQDLESAGFPLVGQKEGGKSCVGLAEEGRSGFSLPVSYSELISLYLARGCWQSLKGTPFQESLNSLFAKIQPSLPAPMRLFLEELERALSSRPLDSEDHAPPKPRIEQITQAIMDRQTLEIQYHSLSKDKVQTRKIDPYRLRHQEGGLYLIAYCHLRQKVLTFSLERIRAARPTSETFVLPEGFSLEENGKDSFGGLRGEPMQVKILFSCRQASWIAERLWHPSQKMQYQLDGSLLMSLEVADTLDLKRWILGFGQEAEVLEPKELRQAIRQEAEALLTQYSAAGAARRKRPPGKPEGEPPKEKLRIEIL